jgi:hypothetical protein
MIQAFNEFYVVNSNPLQVAEDLLLNCRYCTKEGHIIRIIDISKDKSSVDFDMVQRTEMADNELITTLEPKLLKLFWTLMRNNAVRNIPYEEDTD